MYLAAARYDALTGPSAPGSSSKLAREKEVVRELLHRIGAYLPAARTKAHNEAIDDKIRVIREREVTPRGLLEKVFGRSPTPEAIAQIKSLRNQQREPATYVPSGLSVTELGTLSEKLSAYERVLTESIGLALRREEERKQLVERGRLAKEAKEDKRAQEAARIRAMAAAHTGKTRKLAESVRRKIEAQRTLVSCCPYCGNKLGDTPEADHIYPVARGGLSTVDNMVYVCKPCNGKKGQMTLREFAKTHCLSVETMETRLESLGKHF